MRKFMVELTWMLVAAALAAMGLMAFLGCQTTFDGKAMGIMGLMG